MRKQLNTVKQKTLAKQQDVSIKFRKYLTLNLFLVGAVLVARLLQCLVFFVRQRAHPVCTLFLVDFNRFRLSVAVASSSPRFSQKLFRAFAKPKQEGAPFNFSDLVRLVFKNLVSKGCSLLFY